MLRAKFKGDFRNLDSALKKFKHWNAMREMEKIGELGVQALSEATPVDTGKTASSWGYYIKEEKGYIKLFWTNSNVNNHVMIAVILQYGHGTRNGGYVEGIDYINPALDPVVSKFADHLWEAVDKA